MKYIYSFEFSDNTGCNIGAHSFSDAIEKLEGRTRSTGSVFPRLKKVSRKTERQHFDLCQGRLYLKDVRNIEGAFNRITKDELAKLYGLTSYDCALPQDWLEHKSILLVSNGLADGSGEAYDLLRAGTVWNYTGPGNSFGSPFYLTAELVKKMRKLEQLTKPTIKQEA